MFNKKGLGPVVAVALLLVVGVTAVIGFQTWYQSYSSQLFTQSESQGSDLTTGVERIVGETLYFKSNKNNLSISKIEVGGEDCNFQNSTSKGITQIDISSCLESAPSGTLQEAVIYTDQGVYSEEFIANSPPAACYNPETIGTVGTSGVCQGMLIVNRSMLDFAVNNNPLNGGENFYVEYEGINYTFGDSQYNIFTGQITNMSYLLPSESNFNVNINYWDVSNVVDMDGIFYGASSFNQPINNWDVSSVTNMSYMFAFANDFNQNINSWDVSNVQDISDLFRDAASFNQSLDDWDVSSVTNMVRVFFNVGAFNQPLNNWNVSNVGYMNSMFAYASEFNQPLNNWTTSNVTDMGSMFTWAISFNQNLSSWDVDQVGNNCVNFNASASSWTLPKPNLDPSCLS